MVLGTLSVQAQNLILPLQYRAEDVEYSRLKYITNMFYLRNGNQVANPLDINSVQIGDSAQWRSIQLPAIIFDNPQGKNAMGFGYIYNGASKNDFTGAFTLFVSTNPRYNYYKSLIYVDRNGNFDLRDDGAPDTVFPGKSAVIRLDHNTQGYQIELQPIVRTTANAMMLHMNDYDVVAPVLGGRIAHGSEASYYTKRLNILGAKYKNGVDSFLIGVKDVNCNGVYGEDGIDEIMVGAYNGVLNNLASVKCGKNGSAYLERYNVAYNVKSVATNGSVINLYRDTAARLKYSLNKGDKFPRIKFCLPVDKKVKKQSIRKYRNTYTYIYVWQADAPEYIRDSAAMHALGRLGKENLSVIALNHKGGGKYIKYYPKIYQTKIISGFATNYLVNKMKINTIPTGILLDKKQRIVAVGIEPHKVLDTILSLE